MEWLCARYYYEGTACVASVYVDRATAWRLEVAGAHRGRGIGSAILRDLVELGVTRVIAEPATGAGFLDARGWTRTEERDHRGHAIYAPPANVHKADAIVS